MVYSSPDMDYDLQHDAFGNVTNAADASGHVWSYVYGPNSVLLGETAATGDRENVLTRHVDAFRRPTGYGLSVDGVSRGGIGYAYDAEDRLVSVTAKMLTNDAVRVLNAYDVMKYVDESGTTVAVYVYDYFGKIVSQTGPLAEVFSFRFSTKCYDREINRISYQRRFYSPDRGRWLNRDPIQEEGGENLYEFCHNMPNCLYDVLGLSCRIGSFNITHDIDIKVKSSLYGGEEVLIHGRSLLESLSVLNRAVQISSLYGGAIEMFLFACIVVALCITGCDKHKQLETVLDDGILVQESASTISGFTTYGLSPTMLKHCIMQYFANLDLTSMGRIRTCFLALKSNEISDYVKRRRYIARCRQNTTGALLHVQSIAVTQIASCGSDAKEDYIFFVRNRTGLWREFSVSPLKNGLSSVGVTEYDFSCLGRCWMCEKIEGQSPLLLSVLMSEDISMAFVVEVDSSRAAVRYLSSSGIESLRSDSSMTILDLFWRKQNCMIFIPRTICTMMKSIHSDFLSIP